MSEKTFQAYQGEGWLQGKEGLIGLGDLDGSPSISTPGMAHVCAALRAVREGEARADFKLLADGTVIFTVAPTDDLLREHEQVLASLEKQKHEAARQSAAPTDSPQGA